MEIQKPIRRRRYHREEFKPAVIAACCEPGASVVGIAMANGVNANQVRRWMRERDGGDRILARVSASVPQHGLESVLVVVELVLESGVLSAEHVENVLLRLKHVDRVGLSVDPDLIASEIPLADSERYDALRIREANHA